MLTFLTVKEKKNNYAQTWFYKCIGGSAKVYGTFWHGIDKTVHLTLSPYLNG